MRILSIELSTSASSVALLDGLQVLAERRWKDSDVRNQQLFSILPGLIEEAGATVSRIDTFAVGLGPGSFSGLRIALSTANGMALPLGKRVFGINSAESLAWQIMQDSNLDSITIVGDARRGHLWRGRYERAPDFPVVKEPLSLIPVDRLSGELQDCGPIATSDWHRIGSLLENSVPPGSMLIRERHIPTAATAGKLAYGKISRGIPSEPLVPVYLHPAVTVSKQ